MSKYTYIYTYIYVGSFIYYIMYYIIYYIYIYKTFHQIAAEYIFFSSIHEPFFRIYHLLGHKAILINFRRVKSYQDSVV